MKKLALFTVQILLLSTLTLGQDTDVRNRANDAFRELNTGELTLRFVNALNGEVVTGATVTINGVVSSTDFEGKVTFKPEVTNGSVPVVFSKKGFITSEFTVEIMAGTIFQNQVSVSPDLRPESIRIVLDWADRPRDLDAHLMKEGGYHISYRDKKTSADGSAQLDRDDTNGNGPETITINRVDQNDTYTFFVHNYSNRGDRRSTDLSNRSRATVRVYGDNRMMAEFQIPENKQGVRWTVFQIQNGQVILVDQVE